MVDDPERVQRIRLEAAVSGLSGQPEGGVREFSGLCEIACVAMHPRK